MTSLFIDILENKCIPFIRTESRIFDITDSEIITDNQYGMNRNGLLPNANQVTPEYVADLLTKGASIVFKKRTKTKKRGGCTRVVSELKDAN